MAKTENGVNVAPERSFFDRIIALETDKQDIGDDLKVVYTEAKELGIDVKGLKLAVKRHLERPKKRRERIEAEIEAQRILEAIGEFVNTPLGAAAAAAMAADVEWERGSE